MTEQDFNTLEGIYAYDRGATDSGIKNEGERARLKNLLHASDFDLRRFSVLVREAFLSDEALQQGYTLEGVVDFLEWLKHDMGWTVA